MSHPQELKRPDRDCAPRMTDLAAERDTYRVDVPERFNAVIAIVERWATEDPDALAVLSLDADGDVVAAQSASELAASAAETARGLLALGVSKGDYVFVMLPRLPQWYAALLGAMRIGAIPMPGPNLLTAKDIAYRLKQTGAKVAITDASGAQKVDDASQPLDVRITVGTPPTADWIPFEELPTRGAGQQLPDDPTSAEDPLLLYFTSGTVAHPKMVQHVQSYGLAHVGTARFWHDLRPGDLHWTVTDTGWAKAAWGTLFGQMHERAAILNVALGRPDADTIFKILARHKVTSFCAPPTLYRLLVQGDFSKYDLSALRHCTSAGEPLNPEVIRAWTAGTGLQIHDGYGQTETSVLIANYRSMAVRPGSMGRPVPGWEMAVVDDDGRPTEVGTVGNIVVRYEPDRPVGLFPGYHERPDATAEAFRAPYYFTGDKAAIDEDGYFWFEGRSDDVITSSAYRIGPFEVESALIEHPAVMEAAVVGKDDDERTQIVVAFVILAPGYTASAELARELQDHVKGNTAPYKYPREIHFLPELPKTVSGKIRRTELRGRLRAGEFPGVV
jgi:acetyl-CoA synthetase